MGFLTIDYKDGKSVCFNETNVATIQFNVDKTAKVMMFVPAGSYYNLDAEATARLCHALNLDNAINLTPLRSI